MGERVKEPCPDCCGRGWYYEYVPDSILEYKETYCSCDDGERLFMRDGGTEDEWSELRKEITQASSAQ